MKRKLQRKPKHINRCGFRSAPHRRAVDVGRTLAWISPRPAERCFLVTSSVARMLRRRIGSAFHGIRIGLTEHSKVHHSWLYHSPSGFILFLTSTETLWIGSNQHIPIILNPEGKVPVALPPAPLLNDNILRAAKGPGVAVNLCRENNSQSLSSHNHFGSFFIAKTRRRFSSWGDVVVSFTL